MKINWKRSTGIVGSVLIALLVGVLAAGFLYPFLTQGSISSAPLPPHYTAQADDANSSQQSRNFEIISKSPRDPVALKAEAAQQAARLLTKAAAGDAQAQMELGRRYISGYGVKQDYAEAVKWMRRSAEQGNTMAAWGLALLYKDGNGVKQDYAEAYFWDSLPEVKKMMGGSAAFANQWATHLTPEQIAAIDKRVAEWKPVSPAPTKQ